MDAIAGERLTRLPSVSLPDYALSIPEAAAAARVSTRTMWRLIGDGTIRSIRASARRRIVMASELARHLSKGVET